MGRTGKSVARSYMAALDCLIPVEASISGSIALNKDKSLEPRMQIIRDRYNGAMNFLKSADETNPGRSKLSTYVEKQELWNMAVEQYSIAQERQQKGGNRGFTDLQSSSERNAEVIGALPTMMRTTTNCCD